MNRIIGLIIVALVTFGIVLFVKRPELIQHFWLWLVGFAGVIVRIFLYIKNFLFKTFDKSEELYKKGKEKLIGDKTIEVPK